MNQMYHLKLRRFESLFCFEILFCVLMTILLLRQKLYLPCQIIRLNRKYIVTPLAKNANCTVSMLAAVTRWRPPELVLLRGRRLLPSATLMETSGDVEVYLEFVARRPGCPYFCFSRSLILEQPKGELRVEGVCACQQLYMCVHVRKEQTLKGRRLA